MKRYIIAIIISFVFLNSLVAQGYSSKEYISDVNYQYGNMHYNQNNNFEALRYFQTALAYQPGSYLSNIMAGITCHRLEYYASMIYYFQKAVDISNTYQSYGNLGSIYAEIGYADQAFKNLGIALEMNSDYAFACNNMASLLTHHDRDGEAMQLYRKAISLDKKMPDPWYNIGTIYEAEEKLDSALFYYEKAIKVSPQYMKALVRKVSTIKKMGKSKDEYEHLCNQLIERCNKSLADNPNQYESKTTRAEMYALLDQTENMKEDLNAALPKLNEFVRLYPHSYIFLSKRASVLHKLGDNTAAIADYKKALETNPDFPTAKRGMNKLLSN